jgi:hypothetical protein
MEFDMSTENYIEHEVRLRVMKEVTDERFSGFTKQFERLESKMNWVISLLVGGIMLPIFLHFTMGQ